MNFKRLACIGGMAALLYVGAGAPPADSIVPGKLVSLDAEDANLPAVLKILAEKGDLNIITGPGVASGKLTIHMKDVPIDQAVNLVVRAAGLAYERIGNSILVADQKSLTTETGLSAYVVTLRFADATEVKASLRGLSDQIQVDHSGNRLIIVTSPRIISEIEEVVAEIDKPARQVMLEARIVEVSTDDASICAPLPWEAMVPMVSSPAWVVALNKVPEMGLSWSAAVKLATGTMARVRVWPLLKWAISSPVLVKLALSMTPEA